MSASRFTSKGGNTLFANAYAAYESLSDDIKATEPQVPWRELAGFRNVIVHNYLGIDVVAVWLVVLASVMA